jgi:hypothetical protein
VSTAVSGTCSLCKRFTGLVRQQRALARECTHHSVLLIPPQCTACTAHSLRRADKMCVAIRSKSGRRGRGRGGGGGEGEREGSGEGERERERERERESGCGGCGGGCGGGGGGGGANTYAAFRAARLTGVVPSQLADVVASTSAAVTGGPAPVDDVAFAHSAARDSRTYDDAPGAADDASITDTRGEPALIWLDTG